MNTRISYLYRDASNYKQHNEVVVAGKFTSEQIDTIIRCLSDGEYFIPKQVSLPEKRFDEVTEDDHCWFELCRGDFEDTNADPTIEMLPDDIVRLFVEACGNWDDTESFGGAMD